MGPRLLRPSKASGKGRLGEPHHDGNVRKGRDRGTNEAPPVRRDRRVRPAGIRARGWAGVPVRAGERRPGEATETSRGGIRRDVPDLGEGGQGDRPGDRQRPQGEGPDRDEVRPTADSQRAISPPSLFWDLEPIDAPFRRSRGFCNLLRVMAIRPPPPWAPLRSARPVRLLLLGGGRRGDSRRHGGGAPGWNRTALAKASFEAKAV